MSAFGDALPFEPLCMYVQHANETKTGIVRGLDSSIHASANSYVFHMNTSRFVVKIIRGTHLRPAAANKAVATH